MLKQLRRIIVSLLTIAIVATAFMTAFAQSESADNSMETALLAAKSLLNIDDSVFTDFTYGSSYSNYETREGLIWSFNWTDDNYSSIYAQVREDGTLIQYGKYDNNGKAFGFAEISKESAMTIADGFIKKAKPDTYSYYKAPADVITSINNSEYRMNYFAEVNGYAFKAAQVYVGVNKFTGEVIGYSTSTFDPRNYDYENTAGIISEGAAVTAYAEKIGLSLEYRSYFNYEDGSVTVFPAYLFNSSSDRYIGASTGEIVEYVYDPGMADGAGYGTAASAAPMAAMNDSAMGSTSGGGSRPELTPAEIDAIDKVSSYLTSEQALQKLLAAMELEDLDVNAFNDKYISLNRDYSNRDRYCYDISLYRYYGEFEVRDDEIMGLYGRVDAESGKILSFSLNYYGVPSSGEAKYTDEQAIAAAEAFLKKIAPDEYSKSRTEEIAENARAQYNYRGDYYANYIRYENGIPFRNNGLSVSFNLYTGKITMYSLNWYDNARFPGVGNALPPQEALSAYVAQNGSNIMYITTGGGNATLVYNFTNGDYIDPFSGGALNYNGTVREGADDDEPDYSDIAGHWCESVVLRLLENGVYMWGGPFEPNKVMTELEFLQYLLLLEPYYGYTEPSEFFIQRGIDIAADPDKPLTRQEAVRIIVEYLGYGKLAKQSAWFVYPFSDSVDDQYRGYITICYMLGIVSGDNGRFNATGNITRAQAAVILQNLIIAKS